MKSLTRVTTATVDVLDVLLGSAPEPTWGLRVIEISGRPAGTIYPILARLEAAGWVTSRWDDESHRRGPRRRMYRLTEDGSAAASAVSAAFRSRTAARGGSTAWGLS